MVAAFDSKSCRWAVGRCCRGVEYPRQSILTAIIRRYLTQDCKLVDPIAVVLERLNDADAQQSCMR